MNEEDADLLQCSTLFANLSTEERARLVPYFEERLGRIGETICAQGQPGDGLWVIKQGHLKIVRQPEQAEPFMVGEVGPGHTVGEMALMSDEPRTADCTFIENGRMWFLSHQRFDELQEADPKLWGRIVRNLMTLVCSRLRAKNDQVVAFLSQVEQLRGDAEKWRDRKKGLLERLFGED